MRLRVFPNGDPAHRAAQELLPWYLNGTLEPDERRRVETHLSACLVCRRELEAQRALQTAWSALPPSPDVAQALAAMHRRIDAETAQSRPAALGRFWQGTAPWLRGALIGQLLIILALGAALLAQRPAAEYRTLSAEPAAIRTGTGIAVTFSDGSSEKEVRELLSGLALRIVDGPSENGAYLLAVDPARREAAIQVLRGRPSVQQALPVNLPRRPDR